jgi:hypothetical protein
MTTFESDKIYGVPEGIYYGQFQRTDELNARIGSRHFPDAPLAPNINFRPVPTKYVHFPTVDKRKPTTQPVVLYTDYNTETNFNPGSAMAPVLGYINNVDKEMQLRNQFFALQRGGDKGTYIPSRNSDLYTPTITGNREQYEMTGGTHTLLFTPPEMNTSIHPNVAHSAIGKDRFFNHTRTQLRNI